MTVSGTRGKDKAQARKLTQMNHNMLELSLMTKRTVKES